MTVLALAWLGLLLAVANGNNVLLVHSGSEAPGDAAALFDEGFREGLSKAGFVLEGETLVVKTIYLQKDLFSGVSLELQAERIIREIVALRPVVVLTSGDEALDLVAVPWVTDNPEAESLLFFCGVSEDVVTLYPDIFPTTTTPPLTNLYGTYQEASLELAWSLDALQATIPDLTQIVWLSDASAESVSQSALWANAVAPIDSLAIQIETVTTAAAFQLVIDTWSNSSATAQDTVLVIGALDLLETPSDTISSLFEYVVAHNRLSEFTTSRHADFVQDGVMMGVKLNSVKQAADMGFKGAEVLLDQFSDTTALQVDESFVLSANLNRFQQNTGSFNQIPLEYFMDSAYFFFDPPAAAASDRYKVFILHSYEFYHGSSIDKEAGFLLGLERLGFTEENVEFRRMHMDTKTVNSQSEDKILIAEDCIMLIEVWQPDLVYFLDDNALHYVAMEYIQRHPNTTVDFIFLGINGDVAVSYPELWPNGVSGELALPYQVPVTGVYERFYWAELEAFIQDIKPTTRNILYIATSSGTGQSILNDYLIWRNSTESALQLSVVTVTTVDEMKDILSRYQYNPEEWFLICPNVASVTVDGVGIGSNTPQAIELYRWIQTNSMIGEAFELGATGFLSSPYTPDYYVSGIGAAFMAAQTLSGDSDVRDISIEVPNSPLLRLNLARAKQLADYGVSIPQHYISVASSILYDSLVLDEDIIPTYEQSAVLAATFQALAGLLLVMYAATLGFFLVNRANPWITSASLPFMLLMLGGMATAVSSVILLNHAPTDLICSARPAFLHLGYTLTFGPLCLKTFRLMQIFVGLRKKLKRKVASTKRLYSMLSVMVLVVAVYLVIWFSVDPPTAVVVLKDDMFVSVCQSESSWWSTAIYVPQVLMLIWAVQLVMMVRNLPRAFNEGASIAISLYSMAVFGLIVLPMVYLTDDQDQTIIMTSLGVIFISAITWGSMFVSKMYNILSAKIFTGTDRSNTSSATLGPSGRNTNKSRLASTPRKPTPNDHLMSSVQV